MIIPNIEKYSEGIRILISNPNAIYKNIAIIVKIVESPIKDIIKSNVLDFIRLRYGIESLSETPLIVQSEIVKYNISVH